MTGRPPLRRLLTGFGTGVLLALISTAWAWAEPLGGGQAGSVAWGRIVLALISCFALALVGGLVLKAKTDAPAFGQWSSALCGFLSGKFRWPETSLVMKRPRQMQLIETLRLSPQVQMHLVECDSRRLMVATTATGAALLTELAPAVGERP